MASLGQANLFTLVIVVVTVVAVGLVAATIPSVVVFDHGGDEIDVHIGGEQIGDEFDFEANDTEGGDLSDLEGGPVINLVWCVQWLTQPSAVLGMFAGLFGVLYLIYMRFNMATALLSGTFLLPMMMLAYFFLTNCPSGAGEAGAGLFDGYDAMEASREGVGTIPAIPPALAAVLLGGFIVVAAVVLWSMSGRDETLEESEMEFEPEVDPGDFARAAQRARERIEKSNMPVDNAVYQAWLEMTGLLSMDRPETAAPYEFAENAIDVGLAEDDVYELTELFNEVRYGERDAAEREDRALRVLRNIEETYQSSVASEDSPE